MSSNNFIKNYVNLTWNLNANGERVNPRPTSPDIFIAGLKFQYSCQAAPQGSEFPYHMYLDLVDDALEDFDHHWQLIVVWRNQTTVERTYCESSRRCAFYGFEVADYLCDRWTISSAEVHPYRKGHTDEARASQLGNDYRIELTKDGSRIYVNRTLLTQNSFFFQEQLNLPANAEVLHLDDIEAADFLDYVYSVHPPALKLTLSRVRRIMPLAKRFDNQVLISECEHFLKIFQSKDSFELREHLIEVGRHGMREVFEKSLKQMKQSDFKDIDVTAIEEFTVPNTRLLLERLIVPQGNMFSRLFRKIGRALASLFDRLTKQVSKKIDEKIASERFSKDSNHDCVIVVEGHEQKPIYVQKAILAMHSEYFKKLFFGDFKEANANTVTLKDIDFGNFLEYLASVHTPSPPLTMARVSAVLSMADQFRNEFLLKHCSDFLQFKVDKTGAEKLETLYLAEQYDLKTIFTSTLEQLNEDVERADIDIVSGFRPENVGKFVDYCIRRL